jgi:flagellar protein FliJ
MPRFRFKLQAVLDRREMVEQERQRAVAALERDRVRLEGVIRECQGSIEGEQGELRAGLRAGNFTAVRRQSAVAMHHEVAAQRAVLELAGVHQRLQIARAALLEAAKARRAVDLLRERHLEAWRSEHNRKEAAAVDEIAVMRARQNAAETVFAPSDPGMPTPASLAETTA